MNTAPLRSAIACAEDSSSITSPEPLVPWKASTSGGALAREAGRYTVTSRTTPATRSCAWERPLRTAKLPV